MRSGAKDGRVPAEQIEVLAYQIPADGPDGKESDGTAATPRGRTCWLPLARWVLMFPAPATA